MKYSGYTIDKMYYSGQTITAAYSCGGYQVFSGGTPPTPPTPTYKAILTDLSGNEHTIECNSTDYLTRDEITSSLNINNIKSAEIGNCTTHIYHNAFSASTNLSSVTLSESVEHIDDFAFNNCTNLSSINFPSNLELIGVSSFENCSRLTSLEIPDTVTIIGQNAFLSCSGLTSVTIGSGITSIEERAFCFCDNLTSITINASTPPTLPNYNSVFYTRNDCPIYVPSESVNAYKSASGWSSYANRIQPIT